MKFLALVQVPMLLHLEWTCSRGLVIAVVLINKNPKNLKFA